MTTLRQLAEALDLSITTVSRALDDKNDVSAATKVKVREAAARLGYQPNAAARSLRKQRVDTIAVTLPAAWNHVGLSALIDMLTTTAASLRRAGLDLVMVPSLGSANGT